MDEDEKVMGMDSNAVINRLGGGHFADEVVAALLKVTQDVIASGRSGTVTIKLKVAKLNENDLAVTVLEEIGTTLPKSDPMGALFFSIDGEFHKSDPRQGEFGELRSVDPETGEIRDVPTGTAVREAGE